MFKKIGRWLSALLGVLPMAAFAQTTGPFTVPSSDISLKILSQIFGGLTPTGGVDAFGSAISTFNGAILIVGGILATYTLLAGTLGTAHDGEMLGKKFSSVWIPIRYALGTALVLPVLNGGYCMMQQLVMWCILQGVGLANAVWTSYLTSPNLVIPVSMTTAHKKEILDFANNVALAQICVAANASVLNSTSSAGGVVDSILKATMTYQYGVGYSADSSSVYFGDQFNGLPLVRSQCGSAGLPKLPAPQVIVSNGPGVSGKLGDLSSAFQLADITPVYQAHIHQSKILIDKLGVLAGNAINSKTAVSTTAVQAAADNYVQQVTLAATSYANGTASPFAGLITASKTQGWILAGAWFTKLAMMNESLNTAVNSIPSASATTVLGSGFSFIDGTQAQINTARANIMESMNITTTTDNDSSEKDDSKGKHTQTTGPWSRVVQSVVEVFTGLDLQNLQNSPKPAILVLQDAGNTMIGAWSIAAASISTIMLIIGGVKIAGFGVDLAPVAITLMGFLFLPIAGLVTLGFTLAYLLPNLPFLMWIGIVLGWLIMCVEAILAAPLWAVMHLHPNGDDLTGRGGNGYMLLLGLLLRPALTIFGLIAALVLTDLMGEFVNKIFFAVFFSGSSGGGGVGLVTILSVVFSMTVYTSAMVQLFRKTFALMHVIPDQLMRWIGGGQEQMGQYAGGMGEAGQKGVQAAGQAGSFLGEKSAQTIGQAGQQIGQIAEKSRAKKLEQSMKEKEFNSSKTATDSSHENAGGSSDQLRSQFKQDADRMSAAKQGSFEQQSLERDAKQFDKNHQEGIQATTRLGPAALKEYTDAMQDGSLSKKGDTGSNSFERGSIHSRDLVNELSMKYAPEPNGGGGGGSKGSLPSGKPDDSVSLPTTGSNHGKDIVNDSSVNDSIVNSIMAKNLSGEFINPTAAQGLAHSGSAVNDLRGKGVLASSADSIRHGGTTGHPTSDTSFVADTSGSHGGISPSISESSSPSLGANVDSSGSAQFSSTGLNEGVSSSQSFDGSGGSQTGNNTPEDFND